MSELELELVGVCEVCGVRFAVCGVNCELCGVEVVCAEFGRVA
jgi:hypothetical protein